jgi:mannose-6-phosphate isomerase
MLTRLSERRLAKPWGRCDVPPQFGAPPAGERLGEIWFERAGADDPLLIKYLFTSERLSVQVHPDDAAAQAAGEPRGKDEAWVVLAAEPGATIGCGVTAGDVEDLRRAALDGSIEQKLEWVPVQEGDCLYSAAGTVHAIGPGLTLLEIQQNSDVTYRLYDFGRDRELHLEAGLAATKRDSRPARGPRRPLGAGRTLLVQGPKFTVESWTESPPAPLPASRDAPLWLIPLAGTAAAGRDHLQPPSTWFADEPVRLTLEPGAELLVAYSGSELL